MCHVELKYVEGITTDFQADGTHLKLMREPVIVVSAKKRGGFMPFHTELVVVARNQDALYWIHLPESMHGRDVFGPLSPQKNEQVVNAVIDLAASTRRLAPSAAERTSSFDI